MKTIFRFLALAMLLATFSAVTVSTSYAQDPAAEMKALYDTHLANYASNDPAKLQLALDAAKTYVAKFPDDKEHVTYYIAEVTRIEKAIAAIEKKKIDDATNAARGKVLSRFDNAAKSKNIPEIFAGGKEIVSKDADFSDISLDILLTMTAAGFDQATATPPVDTYNADTIDSAKNAIQKIESGKTSTTWGVWSYNFKLDPKDTKFKDNKAYTLGVLNYIIGNVTYYRLGKDNAAKKKEALPYFYKATQYDSLSKANPQVYQAVGAWYLDEAIRVDKERQAILAAMPEKERKDNEQTLAMVGEQKGYADRAIDAYSRAYKLAKANPKTGKDYTDNLYAKLTDLYKFRYDGDTKGIDAFVAKVDTTPFPDPTTPITPVKIELTAPTTTSTTDPTKPATTPATKPAATTTPATKPATTPTTGATKPATSNVDAMTDGKTPVKKVVPKKKGTR